MTASVTISRKAHVGEIRFARPPHNFASAGLLGQLADAIDVLDADPQVRCSVLLSEGRSFCAGADLAGDDAMAGSDGMAQIGQFYVQAERMFRRTKPIVAAIQGAAVGAGLGLALAADFRVIAPAARFSCNFVALGFHPGFGLSHTLPRLLGAQRASWMMLSAQRVKPEAAVAWGLADRLVGQDDLIAEAKRMAQDIAENAPLALLSVRASAQGNLADEVARAMAREHAAQTQLKGTADYAEGVAAVFERRMARFLGR